MQGVLESSNTMLRRRRGGVCGESVDPEMIKTWSAPYVPKSDEDRKKLFAALELVPTLFGHLEDQEKLRVVDAMSFKNVKKGEDIILQGTMGDYFYIVSEGSFNVMLRRGVDEPNEVVKKCDCGDSFGELALLYSTPRAATVQASEDSSVWTLWRDDFRMMLCTAENTKKKRYDDFLSQIEIFNYANEYERGQVSDIIKVLRYVPGENIIRQGEKGDVFYILEEGTAVCVMDGEAKRQFKGHEIEVMRYRKGGYFGELALINNNETRKASVYAVTRCNVLTIEKATFDRVMGPIRRKLEIAASKYPSYASFLRRD